MNDQLEAMFLGACIGAVCGTIITFSIVISDISKTKPYGGPVVIWRDTDNPPVSGFEQVVDIDCTYAKDTVYIERSYGRDAN